jgi:hypothetical protein
MSGAEKQQQLKGQRPHLALPESGLDGPALKQLKEQKEMQLLQQRANEALVQAQSAAAAASSGSGGFSAQLHEERLREYSALASTEEGDEYRDTIEDAEATGGVIEGGTWEHRKRAAEMLKTAQQAAALTAAAAAGVSDGLVVAGLLCIK